MTNQQTSETINRLTVRLMSEARLIDDTAALDQSIVDRLRDAGLPITRFTTGVPSLHPQVDSFSTLWELGKGLTFRQFRVREARAQGQQPQNSPIFVAYQKGESVRCRLEETPQEDEYEILAELRSAGLTDYLVLPLPFGDGSNKAMSFATDRPGGFSDDEITILESVRHALAAAIEARYLRHLARTLMDTYVGPVAGRRVLDGEIKRGSGDTIRAAIWFCDLKDFTALSERLPGQVLIDKLNAYFDAVTSAIEAEEGEVLKFIGDAVLAIFQPREGDESAAAYRALAAARAATTNLSDTNAARRNAGEPEIECGISLHFGDVIYGNVGGETRLDFTVIGPAVNLASRIEGLTRELGRPVLVSAEFAALHGGDFEALGRFALKGLSDKREVYAPK